MIENRPLDIIEEERLGLIGRIKDSSELPWGERVGIVLVHGRAGNETVMWVFSKIIEGFDPIVFAPRAIAPDKIGGYSWWEVESDFRGSISEPKESISPEAGWLKLNPSIEALESAVRKLPDLYGVDPKKVVAIGFSQGGALISSVALANPTLFRGVAMLASFTPNIVRERYKDIDNMSLPSFFMSHGVLDQIIPYEKALVTKEFIEKKASSFHFHHDQVTHKISSSGMRELKVWIEELLK